MKINDKQLLQLIEDGKTNSEISELYGMKSNSVYVRSRNFGKRRLRGLEPPQLKEFDLKVGDTVTMTDYPMTKKKKFKILSIYDTYCLVERLDKKYKTTFLKIDYLLEKDVLRG